MAESKAYYEPPYSSFDNSSSCESLRPIPRRITRRKLRDLPDLPPGRSRMFPFSKRQLHEPNSPMHEKYSPITHRLSQAPTISPMIASKKALKHKTSISERIWHMFQHDRTSSQDSRNLMDSSVGIVPSRPQHPPSHLCPSVEPLEALHIPKTSLPALRERGRTCSEQPLSRPSSGWRRFSSSFEFPLSRQKLSESTHSRSSSSSSNTSSDLSTKRDSNSSWSQVSSNLADNDGAKVFLELFQSHSRHSSKLQEIYFSDDKLLPNPDLMYQETSTFVNDKSSSGLFSSHAELQKAITGHPWRNSRHAKPEDVKAYLDTLNSGIEHVKQMGEILRLKYMLEWEDNARFSTTDSVPFTNDLANSPVLNRVVEQRGFTPLAGERHDKVRHRSRDLSLGTSLVPIKERPTAEEVAASSEAGSAAQHSNPKSQDLTTTSYGTGSKRVSRPRRPSECSLSAELLREPSPPPIQPRNPLRLQKSRSKLNLKSKPNDNHDFPSMPRSQVPPTVHPSTTTSDHVSTTSSHSSGTHSSSDSNPTSAWTTFASPGIKAKLNSVFERINTSSETYPGAFEPAQLSRPRPTSGLSSPIAKRIFATVPPIATQLPHNTAQPTSSPMFTIKPLFSDRRRTTSSTDDDTMSFQDRPQSYQSIETTTPAEKSDISSVEPTPLSTPIQSPTVLDLVLALRAGSSNRSSLYSTNSTASFDLEKHNSYSTCSGRTTKMSVPMSAPVSC